MTFLKSKPTNFVVPSLGEADPEYGSMRQRELELRTKLAELVAERKRLEKELAGTPAPAIRPDVAALLGDAAIDARTALAVRLREIRTDIDRHESALEIIRRRISEARGRASVAVCKKVRPEYLRRADKIAKALEAALEASAEMDALVFDMEGKDVAWSHIGDNLRTTWLGSFNDGRSATYIAAVKAEAAR